MSRQDLAGRVRRGGEAGGALLDDRQRGNPRVESRVEPDLATPVADGQGGDDGPPHHEIHPARRFGAYAARADHRLLDHRYRQPQAVESREAAVDPGERAAEARQDVHGRSVEHAGIPLFAGASAVRGCKMWVRGVRRHSSGKSAAHLIKYHIIRTP
jgi:hypothetical protein